MGGRLPVPRDRAPDADRPGAARGGHLPQSPPLALARRPGAVRVSLTIPQLLANMGIVSFLNPDGSKVLVACNYSAADRTFSAQQETRHFTATVPAKSVVTIIW